MCSRALALALAPSLTRWSCRCRVATRTPPRCATRTRCALGRALGLSPLYLPRISLVSPLHLPCISVTSPPHEVLLWGSGWKGKLGTADDVNRLVPTPVPSLKRKHLQLIVCGSFHTIALSEGGDIFTWGIGTISPLDLPCISPHISPIYIFTPGASARAASWTLISPISPYISPTSPYISPSSRLHLAFISPTSRLHLAHISQASAASWATATSRTARRPRPCSSCRATRSARWRRARRTPSRARGRVTRRGGLTLTPNPTLALTLTPTLALTLTLTLSLTLTLTPTPTLTLTR